ncbi:peptidase inhibitor family I36 protein [Kitasatospora griseola]|uniref:peptidase inhibitor family I36 protein n=1 Tax=Kitasatospora griseola TaxID=2064 RepID=UPI003855ED7C
MRQRVKLSLAAVAALAAALIPAGSADAAPALTGTAACPSGYLCVWDQPDYQGKMYQFRSDNFSWWGWDIDDNDRSWYNNGTSGKYACVWQFANYSGSVKAIAPHTSSPHDYNHETRGSSNDWRAGGCN